MTVMTDKFVSLFKVFHLLERIMAKQKSSELNKSMSSSPYFRNVNSNTQRKKVKTDSKHCEDADRGQHDSSPQNDIQTPSNFIVSHKLPEEFYNVPCEELAMRLLGQTLVRILDDGTRLSGEIVETECYPGGDDVASHSFNGKKTERNQAMFMKPGTAYVYYIYGMYNCFNISSQGDGAAVLIRALEPMEGLDVMQENRMQNKKKQDAKIKPLKPEHLCNGPSKLCQALKIEKNSANTQDLVMSPFLWLENGKTVSRSDIVMTQRIGIKSSGEESVKKLLRFYVLNHPCVSVRDKQAEKSMRLPEN